MAPTRKPGFMAETKPVSQRKRRKSDLVVMWITLWDVILYLATEILLSFQAVLEVGKIFFNSDEIWQLREWLEEHLSQVPDDFSQSWRDGILFCKLLNKLQPGCYPDANRLDTDFGVRNLSKAFHILETRFDIIPKVTVEEIVTCSKGSEPKLVDLLLQLKKKTNVNECSNEVKPVAEENDNVKENGTSETKNCVAKGTGLMVGFVGRAASFGVFCSSISDLNLVVEIIGPSNTICRERITKRSPKKKNVITPWKPLSPHALIRSSSNEESGSSTTDISQDVLSETEKCQIPMEYEIHFNQICFKYFPIIQGEHRITVLSHGLHVSDSPYYVTVEPTVRVHKIESMAHIKSVLKRPGRCQEMEAQEPKKPSVRFQEPSERKERLGKILKRQVLRYIVKINGKDVVVDADSIENLATSLLKMDYELQKRPLIRRNSWGFVGDAERKISVIRQFGIDLDELEAQSIKVQRSHSLSLSPLTKKPQKISSSYECEDIIQQRDSTLETVTEGRVSYFNNSSESHNEEDDVFALINNDFDRHSDENTRGTADEREGFDSSSPQDFGDDEVSESTFCDKVVEELVRSSLTRQDQMPLESEAPRAQSLVTPVKTPEDHLTSASEFFSRSDTGKEFVTQKSETEMLSLRFNEKSHIAELSVNRNGHARVDKKDEEHNLAEVQRRIVGIENSIEEFKLLESTSRNLIQEIPCKKAVANGINNQASEKTMFNSSDSVRASLHCYENSKHFTGIGTLNSKSEDHISQIKEISNSLKTCQCECLQRKTSYEGNLHYIIKNKHSKNDQPKLNIINIPKKADKSFSCLDIKREKGKDQRSRKYQHLGRKAHGSYSSHYKKRARNTVRNSVEDSLEKILQCIMQNVKHEDFSLLSKTASLKSTKTRTASDPTYNSFNKNKESKNLECNRNENVHRETNYENNEGNYKQKSRYKKTIDTSSNLSNLCSKSNIKQNDRGTKFCPMDSTTECLNFPQHIPESFNISHRTKNNNIPETNSMSYGSFSAYATDSTSKNSCESFLKSGCETSSERSLTKGSSSKNACQFTYKHFNPSFQMNRENPVRKQIKLWETSTVQRSYKPVTNHMDKLHVLPELVNIKAKLKFWENAYHRSEDEELRNTNNSKNSEDPYDKEERSDITRSIPSGNNLEGNIENQNQVLSYHGSNEETNINNSDSLGKSIDSKMLNMESKKAKQRSFSDPGVLDKPDDEMEDDALHLEYMNEVVNPASSKDEMSSSNDGNFIELFADDEESSMELFCSTEDEYIDDEISENISTYWGDLSAMKNLKAYDSSEYDEFLQLINLESLQSCADECRFFGIATYFGHVAVKNRFWVLTKGAGRGNLSASVQGIGQHNVAFVGVEYTRKDIYEVTYQVFIPGLYLISVRWMDSPIPGSPFLCKVTF